MLSERVVAYNRDLLQDELALKNCDRLSDPKTVCVLTGQQLGFLGGPALTVIKAITAIKVAREIGAVPVMWLATEDHDLFEITKTTFIDDKGNLCNYTLDLKTDGTPAEALTLDQEQIEMIQQIVDSKYLPKMYQGMRYASCMAAILVNLFRGTGLVFIEPYVLRPLATSFFQDELVGAERYEKILVGSQKKLQSEGKLTPLFPHPMPSLFVFQEGKRRRLKREGQGFEAAGRFYTKEDLLKDPMQLTPAAAARVVLQHTLFPTAATVVGPTEMAYFEEIRAYHEAKGVTMPRLIPRETFTFTIENIPKHFYDNLVHPKNKPQDRVLNWLTFQQRYSGNLIQDVICKK